MVAVPTRAAKRVGRYAGKRSPNLAGAIYGTILATAIVTGLNESASVTAPRALAILLGTGVVFWSAHVYAHLLAGRLRGDHKTKRADVRRIMARERPLFQSTLPLAVPLVAGAFGVIGSELALSLATLLGILMLVAWGVVFARREGQGVAGMAAAAAMNAGVGLLIIALELAVP